MTKSEIKTKKGIVVEALPNTMFRVIFEGTDVEEISILSGRMKRFRIRILVGDKIEAKIDPYGGKSVIIKRM